MPILNRIKNLNNLNYENAVTIKLDPLDRATADSIILGYADKKGYKISYKVIDLPTFNNSKKVRYFFIIDGKKTASGIYNYSKNQLTYKAL